MGEAKLTKGDKQRALHEALVAEVGPGEALTVKQAWKIVTRCMEVSSIQSFYNYLEEMDFHDFISWDRTKKKKKNVPCITILPL